MASRYAVCVAALVAVSLLLPAGCGGVDAVPRPVSEQAPAGDGEPLPPASLDGAYEAFSSYREDHGLPLPPRDAALDAVATEAARDMAVRGYFSPVDPEGLTPFDRLASLGWERAGQSIFHASGGQPDARAVLDAWEGTPPYRENLDGDWDATGLGGWALDGTSVWVQVYAAGNQGEGTPDGGNTLP